MAFKGSNNYKKGLTLKIKLSRPPNELSDSKRNKIRK